MRMMARRYRAPNPARSERASDSRVISASRVSAIFLLFVLSLAIFASSAAAQTTNDGPGVAAGPSTGTLVAAALETAGYYTQSQVLSELAGMLERLGALIYVCCIVAALLSMSVTGRYEVGLWLLVGPPMFFFLIRPGGNAAGAEWQFGPMKDEAGRREKLLRGANVQLAEGDEVSWFFHGFNILVSDTVQQLIGIITDEEVRKPMKFMARQQILDDMFRTSVDKPDILGLAAIVTKECSREMNAARVIAHGQRNPRIKNSEEYKEAVAEYCELYAEERHRVPISPGPARDYLIQLMKLEPSTAATENTLSSMTCQQLWGAMLVGIKQLSKDALGMSENQRIPPNAENAIVAEIEADLAAKLQTPDPKEPEAAPFECANGRGVSFQEITNSKEAVQLIFTAWMLRKMFTNDPRGTMVGQFADHAGVELQPMNYQTEFNRENAQEMVRRFRADRLAETTRYEAFAFAMTLPYIQGVGLYVLATLFPFFALMVIVPGQAGSFLMWCALWVWFKSWDLGWALVMVADDVLWSVMPHSAYYRGTGGPGGGMYSDPVTIYDAAFGGDYSYNLATYYMLLSAMLTAVPILSAHAVLGSKKAIGGVMIDGLRSMSQTLASQVGEQMSIEQLRHVDIHREAGGSAQYVMGELVPHHVGMLMEEERFKYGGTSAQNALDTQRRMMDQGFDEFVDKATDSFLGQWGTEFSSSYNLDQHRAEIKAKIRAEVKSHLGSAKEFTSKNAFLEMAKAQVYVKDASGEYVTDANGNRQTEVLGFTGAMIETLHQAGVTPSEIGRVVRDGMGVEILPNLDAMINDSRGADFVDPTLNNPAKRNDYEQVHAVTGELLADYDHARRGIEQLRRVGDNYQGLAEALETPALLGAAAPGFNKLVGWVAAQESYNFFEQGLMAQEKAAALSAQFVQMIGNEYYYQSGQNQEWLYWEQVRAGISGREEWWNVPDMPYENRASAVLLGETAKGEAMKYAVEGAAKGAMNVIPGGL